MLDPMPVKASIAANGVVGKILDATCSLIGIKDEHGRYLLINQPMAQFHGLSRSAFIGRTPAEIGLTGTAAWAEAPDASGSDAEPLVRHDLELSDAAGCRRRFDITYQSVKSADSGAQFLIEVATEIGALDAAAARHAQAREAEQDECLDLALTNGGLGLVDWHIESGRLAPNRQLAELLELDAGEVVTSARELSVLEHPKDKHRIYADLQAHLHGRSAEFHCEYRLRTARGNWRWMLARGRVVERAPDGRALRYLGTLRDVTALLTSEQQRTEQAARLQAATRISSELAREVKHLESEICAISHREQERIGHDLHDGLGQELTGVSLLLKSLERAIERDAPQLKSQLRSARDLIDQCLATTRALAQGLSPVHLDRDGFARSLEQLAATSTSFYGIPVKFSCHRGGVSPERGAATDLYRIAQEAINNAAKHSEAREVALRLVTDVDRIVMTVEDDGQGIPEGAALKGGMGLKIMRYRATIIGASLEVGSRDGGGTVVRCTLRHPLEGVG